MNQHGQVEPDDGVLPAMDRRHFLSRTLAAGGALAFPHFVPASVLGRGGAVAPGDQIVMGAVGIGGRGTAVLDWMLGEQEVRFVAVADVQQGRRDGAKQMVDARYGNTDCAAYLDFRELLARPDIDAVMLAPGDRWHGPMSMLAMQAGKDVYCEKPACLTLAQGRRLADTARRYGRIFQSGTQRLSEAPHVFAIEMARSGRLGPLHTVYADCRWHAGYRHDWLPEEPLPPRAAMDWDIWLGPAPWRPYNGAYMGTLWYNFHDFATDIAQWGAHTIAQALPGMDVPLDAPVTIEYDGDSPDRTVRFARGPKLVLYRGGTIHASPYWHGSCGERFDGPEGWLAAADGYARTAASSPALLADYQQVLDAYTARTRRPFNHVRDFLACVRSRQSTVANADLTRDAMAINLAADIGNDLKRSVTLDLTSMDFIGDPEANRLRDRAMREPWAG